MDALLLAPEPAELSPHFHLYILNVVETPLTIYSTTTTK